MVTIIQRENPLLREIAKTVPLKDIKSSRIETLIKKMIVALESQDDGVAIAAPQINESLRVFVVSHKVFEITKKHKDKVGKNMICINPVITKISKDRKTLEEGCLSVRYLYGKVSRAHKVSITAYDETGKEFKIGASGLLAQIFQHEIDHLDGILFIDKAKNVQEIIPEHIATQK
ncbi:MAG: peptide deformylase [Candidatus Zambryskibacteria bacterium]|nr:peptide deformylase [Candidatus Zambryskibacteria bacterium]